MIRNSNARTVLTMECRGKSIEIGNRTLIMGILNVTPDSFSDGGLFLSPDKALAQAARMVEEGADIIDIGAESTRPGHTPVGEEEEWQRLELVLKTLLAGTGCSVPLSVDTYKAKTAERALACGAHLINDIWGLQGDPEMAAVIASYNAPVIMMHNQQHTQYWNLVGDIIRFFSKSIEVALKAGIHADRIILDPGIGFGKTPEQNMEVIGRLDEIKSLGLPVLLGVSRKSVIGKTLNIPVEERLEPTIALNTLGIASGADIIRVHDVKANKKAALMTDHIVHYMGDK